LLRRIETEEGQQTGAAAIIHGDLEHAPRAQLHLAVRDRGLDLHRLAIARVLQRHDAGFVLIAQRQMQSQIDIARQPHLLQGLLRRADGLFGSGIQIRAAFFSRAAARRQQTSARQQAFLTQTTETP
jgi:hypothetical protein